MNKPIRILYVEDIPADVAMINNELRKAGFVLQAARVETKEQFECELDQRFPDLIISDHGVPRFDGFSALMVAKKRCPEVPFIFVTGSLGERVAIEAFEQGATDYVLKSDLGKLPFTVHRVLREAADRSEVKAKARALRESEERLRMLFDGVQDYALVMLDAGGFIASWNSGAQRIYGRTADQMLGLHFKALYPPEDVRRGRPMQHLESAASKGRFEEEGQRIGSKGKPFAAHVVITAVRDSMDRLRGFAQVTRDASQRKEP